ncbi:MAG: ADP-ribosylglycohydrolase family protein [Sandaracinaceae bacterium]|nr:ADP-ribosylglycohydrolase family protein [Sandaracinaceae bacterium]
MGDSDPSRQLDLLGVVSGERRHEALAVRWVELDAPGKLGRAAWPGSGTGVEEDLAHLAEHHRVTVLVAVGDAAALLEAAAARSIGVREISPSERGERLEQQVGALAADLRAGRRAVVVSADASEAALPVACALVRMGRSVEEAARAVDGALGAEGLEALRAFAGAPAPVGGASDAHDVRVQRRESQKVRLASPGDPVAGESQRVRLASPLSPRGSRMAGAVLGAAIGDAMGHPTEFIRSLEEIRSQYGPNGVEGFELWIEAEGRRVAPYTDDTQMAEVVLRSLLSGRERGADLDETMREMAAGFVAWANDPLGGTARPATRASPAAATSSAACPGRRRAAPPRAAAAR